MGFRTAVPNAESGPQQLSPMTGRDYLVSDLPQNRGPINLPLAQRQHLLPGESRPPLLTRTASERGHFYWKLTTSSASSCALSPGLSFFPFAPRRKVTDPGQLAPYRSVAALGRRGHGESSGRVVRIRGPVLRGVGPSHEVVRYPDGAANVIGRFPGVPSSLDLFKVTTCIP